MFTARSKASGIFRFITSFCAMIGAEFASPDCFATGYAYTLIKEQGSDWGGGDFLSAVGQRKINDAGEVSYLRQPLFASHRIDRGDGTNQTLIASPSFWGLDQVGNGTIANSGDVYFVGGYTATTGSIFRGDGGNPVPIVFGNQDPSTAGTKTSFHEVSASNSGNIAWRQGTKVCSDNFNCGTTTESIEAIIGGSGTTIAEPVSGWTSIVAYAPAINDAGRIAFVAYHSSDPTNAHLVLYNGPGNYTHIDNDFGGGKGYSINNSGAVAYAEAPAVKAFHNGVTTTVASTADGFNALMKSGTGEVFINDSGQVAFWGSVTQYQSQSVNWNGIYTGPDILNDRVVIFGDNVLGHAVNSVELLGMNNSGQMLLSVVAQSPDTWAGLVVATPPSADYNHNGVIDAADYVVWRKTGINGQQGYDLWRAKFGDFVAGGAGLSSSAIPEPTSLALVFIGIALLSARRESFHS